MNKTQVTYATAGSCSLGGCERVADLVVTIQVGPHDWHAWRTCFAHASDEELALMDEAAAEATEGKCVGCGGSATRFDAGSDEWHMDRRDPDGRITVALEYDGPGRLLCATCWAASKETDAS